MLDPVSLLTTASPAAPSPTVASRVVVVLPLVPVTSTTCRPALEVLQQPRVDTEPGAAAGDRPLAPTEPA